MTSFVKQFIEYNIGVIENENYVELFSRWYDNTPFVTTSLGKLYSDAPYVSELVNTLIDAGVLYQPLYDASIKVLQDRLEWMFSAYKTSGVSSVYMKGVMSEIRSGLAIRSIKDLHELILQAADKYAVYDQEKGVFVF